jgi:hypothetical protein
MSGKKFRQTLRFTGNGESLRKDFGGLPESLSLVIFVELAFLPREIRTHFHVLSLFAYSCIAIEKTEDMSLRTNRNISTTYFVNR